jgi:ADP-heptose:LPS heptosyltransferase
MPNKLIKKVLLIRQDGLGDTLLMTPLMAALKQNIEGLELSVLASPIGAQALKGNPAVDNLLVVDGKKLSPFGYLKLAFKLRRKKYDVAISISEKFCSSLLTWLSGSRIRIGFFPGTTQPLKSILLPMIFTHRIQSPNDPSRYSDLHEVERYMELLHPVGIKLNGGELKIYLPEEKLAWAKNYILSAGGGSELIALHLSQKWATEGWPKEFLAEMIEYLLRKMPYAGLVVTYGELEAEWVKPVLAMLPKDRVHIYFSRDFYNWAALLSQCKVLITMDTGAAHVATALHIPMVDVFPSEYFEHCSSRWYPWHVPHRVVKRESLASSSDDESRKIKRSFLENILGSAEELMAGSSEKVET